MSKTETLPSLREERFGFTPEQVNVIKATIAPGTTNDELSLFLMVCQKTGLDPFSRQIYLSTRKSKDPRTDQWIEKKTPETTIDGFRVIAERSGKYQGQLGPYWCGDDGEWKDVWLSRDLPAAAKVGILRSDFKEPIWGVALFAEYVQTKSDGKPNSMWNKMGANQLAKCAESLGLRKAFPRDLSGMYSREEMQQSENERGSREAAQDYAQTQIARNNESRVGRGLHAIEAPKSEAPMNTPEQRHTALVMEANAVLDEPANQKVERIKGDISFKALKNFRELKDELRKVSGTDQMYYEALTAAGVGHADELSTVHARNVYKHMSVLLRTLKQDKALKEDLEGHLLRIGAPAFMAVLGSNGFSEIDEVMANATGAQLDGLLRELKEKAWR